MLDLSAHPGRIYVLATLLPLLPVVIMLMVGLFRNMAGRNGPTSYGAYLSVICLMSSAVLSGWGAVKYFDESRHVQADTRGEEGRTSKVEMKERWEERIDWVAIGTNWADTKRPPVPSSSLQLGYRIDQLSALMFSMVTGIGSMIFLFALGYMKDERNSVVHDHAAHTHRRGRFDRFYLYLSLFAFSMLNLLIADNLFQVFVSWELVGVCSFFLIGFYYERRSASTAANKAFIVNRIGDAGFLIGIAVAFASFGTLNIAELNAKFESGNPHDLSHLLWVTLGLGIFLGAVGKSAQVPLQTWLPDAMEGPTPVSALIHAATMVAAGVYLVGRCYPMFAPEVLLVIAYVGLVTLFISATTALVMTDIKRVLAYSTCSQLGYMMLALGVGGWTAGLLHLLTHAFFKALLFLCAGSVIHGLHHEQDLRRMGGLRRKMPVTAFTMLVGVLAISGAPLFSGWYSKDMILSASLGFSLANTQHFLLFFGPLLTAGLTAFYMFRLWFLAFGGEPRDRHLYDQAHESQAVMTVPLMVLSVFSIGVAWGWPVWNAEASALGQLLHAGQPQAHGFNFEQAHKLSEAYHLVAGAMALGAALAGFGYAWFRYGKQAPTRGQLAQPSGLFARRWYFDDVYDFVFVRRTVNAAKVSAAFDRTQDAGERAGRRVTLDGLVSSLAGLAFWGGERVRAVQTGRIRGYVLVLALTVVGLIGILMAFVR